MKIRVSSVRQHPQSSSARQRPQSYSRRFHCLLMQMQHVPSGMLIWRSDDWSRSSHVLAPGAPPQGMTQDALGTALDNSCLWGHSWQSGRGSGYCPALHTAGGKTKTILKLPPKFGRKAESGAVLGSCRGAVFRHRATAAPYFGTALYPYLLLENGGGGTETGLVGTQP